MKILIIGDIFGRAGKETVTKNLLKIKEDKNIDLVIANAENISKEGKGISENDYNDLKASGVDYITLGNHAFKDNDVWNFIDSKNDIIRPFNFLGSKPGKGFIIFEYKTKKILLFNLLGREFMQKQASSPFDASTWILNSNKFDLAILDFHTETTSEKKALAYFLRNRVKVFVGTHTHIQTSDWQITEDNQAYITDLGMTGIEDSAIGVEYEAVISKLKDNNYLPFKEKTSGTSVFSSIIVELDDNLLPIGINQYNFKTKVK